MINKIDKLLSRLIKKKKRTQINNIWNARGEITTDTTEIQRIVRNQYKELYAKKFENPGEMEKFPELHNLPKLNEEAEILNRPIIIDENEAIIKKVLAHKSSGPDSHTRQFYKTSEEELMPILYRLIQKIQEDGRLPNSFYEASYILIPKPDTDTTKKRKQQAYITDEHRHKNPQQNIGQLHPAKN